MKNLNHIIDKISYDKIVTLLRSLKWSEYESLMHGRVLQYVSPDEKYAVLVPTENSFDDYYSVMKDTLNKISSFMNVSIEALINRIFGVSYDIIKWRVAGHNTNNGTIPFLEMSDTIDCIKDILATSYIDVVKPEKYHNKIYTSEVNDNISKYSFGQTEFGSYIFNIMCPLAGTQLEAFQEDQQNNLPINRRINMHIFKSINRIQDDILSGNVVRFDENVAEGVYSVNFLDSLRDIYDNSIGSMVNLNIDWCKSIEMVDEEIPSNVVLNPKLIDIVSDVAERYRPKREENVNRTYYGKIESISSESELEQRESVNIKIVTIDENNKKTTIHSSLNYQQYYADVLRAFEGGLNVKLSGTLRPTRNKQIVDGSIEILD